MWKECNVVMLPTNEKAIQGDILIPKSPHRMFAKLKDINVTLHKEDRFIPHRLYILSDKDIKEGDWFIHSTHIHGSRVKKAMGIRENVITCKDLELLSTDMNISKIIATTDKLHYFEETGKIHNNTVEVCMTLPQPSDAFIQKYIEEYNKGNVIEKVMVEYHHLDVAVMSKIIRKETIRINPKDNTITIKEIKDSWTREEVDALIDKYGEDVRYNFSYKPRQVMKEFHKDWKQENL